MIKSGRRVVQRAVMAIGVCGAVAGAQGVDSAAFRTADGVAIRGYDPVAYFTEARPVEGSATFVVTYQGATWRFMSAAHRDLFLADPARYAPQYGGYCAFGVAGGYKAPIDPAAWSIVNGKLYLNYDRRVQARWKSDIPGYLAKSDAKWPTVRLQRPPG